MAFAAAVFVSGVGINYALKKRSVLSFAGERWYGFLYHCCLPCSLLFIPLQVYFEWLQEGKITMSYASFIPRSGTWFLIPMGRLPGAICGSYLPVRLLYITAAGICSFKIKRLARFRIRLAEQLSHPVVAALLFIPFTVYYFTLYLEYPEQQSLFDDWFVFIFSISLFSMAIY